MITLLAAEAVGGKFQQALPAAAAVEILHNFSLIHDDIEDNSDQRRGRETLWKIHGVPLALNAGDAMFSLAFLALDDLVAHHTSTVQLQANQLLSNTCLALTKGQHLDISFESESEVGTEDYLQMISGKTAALLAASMQLGAHLGGASEEVQQIFHQLGINVGMAFQVYDDLLGIWGDPSETGKSTATDLLARKKTLPILFGLQQQGKFARMWRSEITPENAGQLADQLKAEGAYSYTQELAADFTSSAHELLTRLAPLNQAGEALAELISLLIQRNT
jgi:geranylgeranyl diphosphate synthase type I